MGIVILVILGLLLLGIIGTVMYFVSIYNGLIMLRNNIDKAWANIDVLLTQRFQELPKLVDACKAYMKHERETLERVIQARNQFNTASSPGEKASANDMMTSALTKLFAVAESYPDLKANTNFLQLQSRVTDLENEIADRREFYNDSVNTYNIRIKQIPDVFVAGFLRYEPYEMFKAKEEHRQDVKLDFS